MRPRRMAAENFWNVLLNPGDSFVASMRPRRMAAENRTGEREQDRHRSASMRPRRMAAENVEWSKKGVAPKTMLQ